MLEAGSLSASEYEAQVRARRDFQRLQRRDSDGDRQVWLLAFMLTASMHEEQASSCTSGWVGASLYLTPAHHGTDESITGGPT